MFGTFCLRFFRAINHRFVSSLFCVYFYFSNPFQKNHLRGSFVADAESTTNKFIDLEIIDMLLKAVPASIKSVNAVDPAAQKCPKAIKHWGVCDEALYETKGPGSVGCLGKGGEKCECFTRNDKGWNYYSWFCKAAKSASSPAIAFHA